MPSRADFAAVFNHPYGKSCFTVVRILIQTSREGLTLAALDSATISDVACG